MCVSPQDLYAGANTLRTVSDGDGELVTDDFVSSHHLPSPLVSNVGWSDGEEVEDDDDDDDEAEDEDAAELPSRMQPASHRKRSLVDTDATVVPDHVCRWESCNRLFGSTTALSQHLASDHVPKRHAVRHCLWEGCTRTNTAAGVMPKDFRHRDKLLLHLRLHTGDRPYACHRCERSFPRADSLAHHVRTHLDVRTYRCTVNGCQKEYYHAKSLRKHQSRVHGGART